MAKFFQKPIDDDWFNSLSKLELSYYDAMIKQDEEEEANRLLEAIEYMAIYVNPDAVQRVRELRATESEAIGVSTNNLDFEGSGTISYSTSDEQFALLLADNSEDGRAPVFRYS